MVVRGWGPRASLALAGALVALAAPARGVGPGEIVVADFPAAPQPSALVRFDAAGNPLGTFAGAAQGIVAPRDLAFDAAYAEGARLGLEEAAAVALAVDHPDLAAGSGRFSALDPPKQRSGDDGALVRWQATDPRNSGGL